jgi:hypothetical protein
MEISLLGSWNEQVDWPLVVVFVVDFCPHFRFVQV